MMKTLIQTVEDEHDVAIDAYHTLDDATRDFLLRYALGTSIQYTEDTDAPMSVYGDVSWSGAIDTDLPILVQIDFARLAAPTEYGYPETGVLTVCAIDDYERYPYREYGSTQDLVFNYSPTRIEVAHPVVEKAPLAYTNVLFPDITALRVRVEERLAMCADILVPGRSLVDLVQGVTGNRYWAWNRVTEQGVTADFLDGPLMPKSNCHIKLAGCMQTSQDSFYRWCGEIFGNHNYSLGELCRMARAGMITMTNDQVEEARVLLHEAAGTPHYHPGDTYGDPEWGRVHNAVRERASEIADANKHIIDNLNYVPFLQICSDYGGDPYVSRLMWSDSGELTIAVPKTDLAKGDFSAAYTIMEHT